MLRRLGLQPVFTAAALMVWAGAGLFLHAQQLAPAAGARISAPELADLMATRAVTILDVRDEGMFRRGHLPGATLVPPDRWREAALALKDTTMAIVAYCSCPQEETSLRAAARFQALGVSNVRALTGGYEAWAESGRPVVTPDGAASAPVMQGGNDGPRESWQRVPDIFEAMGVAPGAIVADIGAGNGFFTTRLARAVGASGKVYAVDISQNALARLGRRLQDEQIANVDAILGTPSDPRLPAGVLDAALIVNAYHEMTEHQAMLEAIRRALKPAGRLVILDSVAETQRGLPRAAQESRHQVAPHFVQRDALDAGFAIARFDAAFTRPDSHAPEYLLVVTPVPTAATGVPGAPAPDGAPGDVDTIVAALDLRAGMTVVDLGAGTGAFTRRFARVVGPTGRAIALDIDPDAVDTMTRDAASQPLPAYEVRLVAADDPGLAPATADVIFLRNTYHHLTDRVTYARKLIAALKPGGRLVIVDFPPDEDMRRMMPEHPDRATVERELAAAGFRLLRAHDFLRGQFFLEFAAASGR
jgi:ubiquinone/menaquinone biosynthesis C-methylase UbiE/rhodanese-related sulfurtransferase